MNSLVKQAKAIFSATTIEVVHAAADQDGYDGGFVAFDGTVRPHGATWGSTVEQARFRLKLLQAAENAGID